MILVDANILLYAYDSDAPQHETASRWLTAAFEGADPVLLPWMTVLAFLRISTNARAWRRPLSISEAVSIVDEWLSFPNVVVPEPTEHHWPILKRILPQSQCRGPLVMDAHIAALAIEHGANLCTNDRDFARFTELRLLNPLE